MLERLNEWAFPLFLLSCWLAALIIIVSQPSLTESLEQTRLDKRKLEAQVAQLQSQSSSASSSSNNVDVEELQDQIADLEEELKDAKAREQKVRSQLLDVSTVFSLSRRLNKWLTSLSISVGIEYCTEWGFIPQNSTSTSTEKDGQIDRESRIPDLEFLYICTRIISFPDG